MVIGIVVSVLEDENQRLKDEQNQALGVVTIEDLHAEISELKKLVQEKL